jgi:membrane protein YqaA with SNARE-associated domain
VGGRTRGRPRTRTTNYLLGRKEGRKEERKKERKKERRNALKLGKILSLIGFNELLASRVPLLGRRIIRMR